MTTLLAVTGLSPAIITETLWALARERPTILPGRVEFITTATGAARLEELLFTPRDDWEGLTVWETLRRSLGATEDQLIAQTPQVITASDGTSGRALPLDDIRTPAENAAAAEFIFSRVWDVVRDPDRRLIASVAGGRKTMGALLHAAVSLIGREDDRIHHVLVSPPFDTLPDFFFPSQPERPLVDRNGRVHEASAAEVMLAEVPFVPLRNRFRDLDELPASFLGLRDECSERLKLDADRPVPIRIDHANRVLEVDGKPYPVRERALAILHFVLRCQQKGHIAPDQTTAAEAFCRKIAETPDAFGSVPFPDLAAEDFRRELNHLRSLLKGAAWKPASRTLRQAPFSLEIL